MMMMSQIAQALGAPLHGADVLMTGVSKDTRDIHQGDLYVALKGEHFDGHRFVADADSAGAVGALVSDAQSSDISQVRVADTRVALGQLAGYWRQQWQQQNSAGKLIGITGSNGKTSVKEMCRKILNDFSMPTAVLATKGNLNNDIGLPMMLLELREQHRFAVIEMGANHVGEIDYLTAIAQPDVALVNNVGPAHLEGFGSLENIAKTKAEIYNGLHQDGVAIINKDDAFSVMWQERCVTKKIVSFSMLDKTADVYAKALSGNRYLVVISEAVAGEAADMKAGKEAELMLAVPGKHNVMNALAAIAATLSVGVSLSSIVRSLAEFKNIQGRLTIATSTSGCRVIDDSYNANPLSVSAAIDVLASMTGETVLVLGDMGELGEDAKALHAEVGIKAKAAGINMLFATGVLSAKTVAAFGDSGFHFRSKDALINALNKKLKGKEIVLVKGSRSAAMEEVVERILTHENNNKRVN
ncbi:MAG: UDP-N-acetylmuramoyl-tripeptide--D-alanyl-D-alanine ligase [Gammaproteobacteria bacterium]|nr:UDP-N-acetylmuramoyl-tripeptide--D-alanyl-D-alanine ligase [Gammaproteobacteria bacterium]